MGGDSRAIEAALAALEDSDAGVKGAAASAIKKLCVRGDSDTRGLLRFVGHPDTEVRRLAVELLGFVASSQDAQALSVLRTLQASDDVDMQLAAEQALRQIR